MTEDAAHWQVVRQVAEMDPVPAKNITLMHSDLILHAICKSLLEIRDRVGPFPQE